MKKKKILIHSIVFSPDGVSTAYLYNDIAVGFQKSGYDVVVLSTTPHYNLIPEEMAKQPMKKKWGGIYYISNYKGILVYHVPQKKFRSFIARAVGFAYWHLISFILGIFQKNIAVILSPSPPLTIGLISICIGKIKKAKVIYNVQEIYPDLLINKGDLNFGLLTKFLKTIEKIVYDHSDAVVTIDEIFYKTIVERFRDPSKLSVIPNFVDTDIYKPEVVIDNMLEISSFPKKDVLKLMYAGNIGYAQDWQSLLHLAKFCTKKPVEFWVIGEGVMKTHLEEEIKKNKLENIHVLPYQPRNKMSGILSYGDIHFIFMNPQMEGQGFPSKVYTIMACSKPLVVLSGINTPLSVFLNDKHCAFIISDTETESSYLNLEKTIDYILDNRILLDNMGKNGSAVVERFFSKQAVVEQYITLADKLIGLN